MSSPEPKSPLHNASVTETEASNKSGSETLKSIDTSQPLESNNRVE